MVYTEYSNATNLNNFLYGTDDYPGLYKLLRLSVEDFHTNYFDIDTCDTNGLRNWGKILDISNSYQIPDYSNSFGFGDIYGLPPVPQYPQNFDHGAFWEGKLKIAEFSDEEYRLIIKLKYRILTSNFSIRSITDIINLFVQSINSTYKFRTVTTGKMQVNYEFNFIFEPIDIIFYYVIKNGYILPIPIGVQVNVLFGQNF